MSWRQGVIGALIAGAMVVSGLTPAMAASPVVPTSADAPLVRTAVAASAGDWDPGYIISDENFYNSSALDVPGVQAFINAKNPGCAAGVTCLRNFVQPTPSMPASAYCAAIPGAAWESAASIITRVGIACGISQKVLLVLLQKEQGLVTATAPSYGKFNSATGFACPDTAACDSSYGGFFYQVYYAARQYQIYKARPASFNHRPNAWNNVRIHPNAACGATSVYIRNSATAGLYNYTPYQPNAAALANMYGTGDGCSSYGNRNFWRLWSDWFGSPITVYGLVRAPGSPTVYLQSGSSVHPFASPEIQAQYSAIGAVADVSAETFAVWTVGAPIGAVVQSTDGSRYVVDQGRRHRLIDCAQAFDYAIPCEGVPTIGAHLLGRIPFAGNLNYTARLPDGTMWLLQDGVRKQFADPASFLQFGIPATPSEVSAQFLAGTTVGVPAVSSGLFWDGATTYRQVTSAGVLDASAAGAAGWSSFATRFTPESIALLPATGSLPLRMSSSGRLFVAAPGGWLEVASGHYGDASVFTSMPTGSFGGVPIVARVTLPHFVRESSSSQRYFIGGGVRLAVTPEAQATIAATYGLPSTLHIIADGALTGVPERLDASGLSLIRETGTTQVFLLASGNRYPIGDDELLAEFSRLGTVRDIEAADIRQFPVAGPATRVVRGASGEYLLLDNGRRYTFSTCAQVRDYGYDCAAVPALSRDQVSAFAAGGGLNFLVRRSDGSIWLLQAGVRRLTPDPTVLVQYGMSPIPSTLTDSVTDDLPVGPPVLVPGVYANGAGVYRLVDPAGRIFDLPAAHGRLLGARTLDDVSFASLPPSATLPLRAESGGRYVVAVSGGWLQVDPAAYGGAAVFSSVPSGAIGGAPVVRIQPLPHFVREQSSGQVWFVGGGVRLAVTSQMQQTIAATYGLDSRVWVAADGALEGVPVRTL